MKKVIFILPKPIDNKKLRVAACSMEMRNKNRTPKEERDIYN